MQEREKKLDREFINFLISDGYLEQSAGSFPVLRPNERARKVLKNETTVFRRVDEKQHLITMKIHCWKFESAEK